MKQYSCLILALIALAATANAQAPQPLVHNVLNRDTVSLNGKWKYLVDQYDEGKSDWYGLFKDATPVDPTDRVEYGYDTAPWIYVPGDWNSQKPELLWYEGPFFYRKRFDFEKEPGKRYYLHLDGANYITYAYLNAEKLGEHEGGFTPFNFEITEGLKNGENSVVIRVDNTRQPDGVPTMKTDWWNYGGITRDIQIVAVPNVFIQDYFIQLKKGDAQTIAGWVQLDGAQQPQSVRLQIPDLDIDLQLQTDANGKTNFEVVSEQIQYWSPEDPKRYEVILSSETDRISDRIGFRTIEVEGTDILLNGKPVFLRAISIHEENPIRGGRAFSPEDARMLLGWAKELNCNMVRLAHYPHNAHMLEAADAMGLMVWEELPVYWNIDWDNEKTYQVAEQQLGEAIARDKNRAAIIIWSMANETHANEDRNRFVRSLFDFTRAQDNTRLVSAASYFSSKSTHTDLYIDDPFGEYADLMAVNFYNAWYTTHTVDELKDIVFHYKYDKPLFISEFGAGAQFGKHGDRSEIWTEEFQAYYYSEKLKLLETVPEFRGCSPWILFDFRCPRRFLPEVQDYWNKKGVISERGMKKQAFYVLRDYYRQKATAE